MALAWPKFRYLALHTSCYRLNVVVVSPITTPDLEHLRVPIANFKANPEPVVRRVSRRGCSACTCESNTSLALRDIYALPSLTSPLVSALQIQQYAQPG